MGTLAQATRAELREIVKAIGSSAAVFSVYDLDISVLAANRDFMRMTGREWVADETDLSGDLSELIPSYALRGFSDAIHQCSLTRQGMEAEFAFDFDGSHSYWRCVFSPVLSEDGRTERVFLTALDITEKHQLRRALDQSHEKLERILGNAHDSIIVCGEDQKITRVNYSAEALFGYSESELVGQPIDILIPEDSRPAHPEYMENFKASPIPARTMHERSEVQGLKKNGSIFWADISISKSQSGEGMEFTAIVRDVSEKLRLLERLKRESVTDPLTGLYNRRHLTASAEKAVASAQRHSRPLSFILFDLDNFKQVNDKFGHHVGDVVLRKCAEAIGQEARESDTCARFGGEEFCILLDEATGEQARELAERLRRRLSTIEIADNQSLTASFGVAAWQQGWSVDDLFRHADDRLYVAKSNGKNRVD